MTDYIKRDDLLELYKTDDLPRPKSKYVTTGYVVSVENVRQNILAQPAADVVEVVRCKDCKHCSIDYYPDGNEPLYVCLLEDRGTDKDFYCANGERVSEDD